MFVAGELTSSVTVRGRAAQLVFAIGPSPHRVDPPEIPLPQRALRARHDIRRLSAGVVDRDLASHVRRGRRCRQPGDADVERRIPARAFERVESAAGAEDGRSRKRGGVERVGARPARECRFWIDANVSVSVPMTRVEALSVMFASRCSINVFVPPPPEMVSLPPPPVMTSSPAVPMSVSLPAPPSMAAWAMPIGRPASDAVLATTPAPISPETRSGRGPIHRRDDDRPGASRGVGQTNRVRFASNAAVSFALAS